MADKGWKQYERRMCRDVGVERQAITGERDGADNKPHPLFCFQFKLRAMLPSWIWTWLGGVVAVARLDNKIGVLVVKVPRMRDDESLVILRWKDWVDLHGEPGTVSRTNRSGRPSDPTRTSDPAAG